MNSLRLGLYLCLLFGCSLTIAAPIPIKVGILVSKTGSMSEIGTEALHGYQLAIESLNNKSIPSPYHIEWIIEDSRSTPDPRAINKLIQSDQVAIVLGDSTSTATFAAAPIAQNAGVPLLSPSSTGDRVTTVGSYIFRACLVDSLQGSVMAHYARTQLNAKTAAILVDMDTDHLMDLSKVFKSEFEKKGGAVLKVVTFRGSHDTSYIPQITELRRLKADVLYAPVYYSKMGTIFKLLKTFQVKSRILGTDAWDNPQLFKLAEGATADALFTNPFSYLDPNPRVQAFRKAYKEKYHVEPSSYAALAYDSVFILEDVLTRISWPLKNQSLRDTIRDQLARTKGVQGVTGDITFDAQRNASKSSVTILRLTEKGYVYHSQSGGTH